jgi:hypothetical protein
MRKQWTSILAGFALAITGCAQTVEMNTSPAPSMGTLRHRTKSYDLRKVVAADAGERQGDPFLREMRPADTYARSNDQVWAGGENSEVELEDQVFAADLDLHMVP